MQVDIIVFKITYFIICSDESWIIVVIVDMVEHYGNKSIRFKSVRRYGEI